MIQAFRGRSNLIALADAEQRIYEFRGADPKRIGEFISACAPEQFDFGAANKRSNGTDIVSFGNDLLTGANKNKTYNDVAITRYGFYGGRSVHFPLKVSLIRAIRRQLKSDNKAWSIAVLVPTKKLMLTVSDYLSSTEDKLPTLMHEVALDTEGPALAAILIAGLLEAGATTEEVRRRVIVDLCAHIRGRTGANGPTQAELKLTGALDGYLATGRVRSKAAGDSRWNGRRVSIPAHWKIIGKMRRLYPF